MATERGRKMDNKLDINVTEKKVSDENMLKTVEEALMKNELCLFMGETGTFMSTGTTDDAEEIFLKLQSVLLAGFLSMEKVTDYDIEQILLLQLEAVKEIKKELPGVTPPKGSILLKGGECFKLKSLKDVKPGDKIFVLNSNRGYLKEPQIEILTANKVGILYIYTDYDKYKKSNGEAVESSLDVKAFATLEEAETGLFMIKARKYYRNSIK